MTKATTAKNGEWFGHPKGLYVLFFTEMWERFSYYGMRALLVLYLTKRLILDANAGTYILGFDSIRAFVGWFVGLFGVHETLSVQALSSQIYGLYTGFVYFTPFFGGILADRVFGQRKSVYIGGVLMAIGARPRWIVRLLIVESALLGAVGTLFGTLVGSLMIWHFGRVGLALPVGDAFKYFLPFPSVIFLRF